VHSTSSTNSRKSVDYGIEEDVPSRATRWAFSLLAAALKQKRLTTRVRSGFHNIYRAFARLQRTVPAELKILGSFCFILLSSEKYNFPLYKGVNLNFVAKENLKLSRIIFW